MFSTTPRAGDGVARSQHGFDGKSILPCWGSTGRRIGPHRGPGAVYEDGTRVGCVVLVVGGWTELDRKPVARGWSSPGYVVSCKLQLSIFYLVGLIFVGWAVEGPRTFVTKLNVFQVIHTRSSHPPFPSGYLAAFTSLMELQINFISVVKRAFSKKEAPKKP